MELKYSYDKNRVVRLDRVVIGRFETSDVLIKRAKNYRKIFHPIMTNGVVLPFVTMRKQIGPALKKAIDESSNQP